MLASLPQIRPREAVYLRRRALFLFLLNAHGLVGNIDPERPQAVVGIEFYRVHDSVGICIVDDKIQADPLDRVLYAIDLVRSSVTSSGVMMP